MSESQSHWVRQKVIHNDAAQMNTQIIQVKDTHKQAKPNLELCLDSEMEPLLSESFLEFIFIFPTIRIDVLKPKYSLTVKAKHFLWKNTVFIIQKVTD